MEEIQSQVVDVRSEENSGKQNFLHKSHKLTGLVTKAIKGAKEECFLESLSTTNAIKELNGTNMYVEVLELINKDGPMDALFVESLENLEKKSGKKVISIIWRS